MKNHAKTFLSAILLITIMAVSIKAEAKPKSETVTIKTSAICGSCKNRIEKVLKATAGVEEAVLNVNNKKVKVKYDPSQITADQIRQVISKTGYDADDVKKDEAAFNKLPACCQRPMEGDHD